MRISDLVRLLRVEQWYKNSLIFISVIFSFNLFNKNLVFLTFLGFISLCFISSSYYIINDMVDIKKDRHHPEKRNRPLASGRIKLFTAGIISIICFNFAIFLAYSLSVFFLYAVLTLFTLSLIYSFYIRKIAFLDIIFISINFVIRAVSGIFIIEYPASSWVILSTFFISIFLVSCKRFAELDFKEYRPSFNQSDKKPLEYLLIVSIACVFIFFSIYSILTERPALLVSIPIALYITISFARELHNSPKTVRNPEKFIFKFKNLAFIILWLITIVGVFYIVYM